MVLARVQELETRLAKGNLRDPACQFAPHATDRHRRFGLSPLAPHVVAGTIAVSIERTACES